MSNRLESLNSKKPNTTNKPGLKFKPKVVQRKSKEERAKVAPQVKQEQPKALPTRGRGGARGGRGGRGGRNNYAGTHLVTSGPLSAGSVAIGNPSGSKLGLTSDLIYNSSGENVSTNEFINSLKVKDRKTKSLTPGASESDDEDDPTKINMTEHYRYEDDVTSLFPYRPFRDDGIQRETEDVNEEKPIKIEQIESNTPTPAALSITRENTEAIEDKIELIKENKAKLESKITQSDSIITDEASKLITDHEQIVNLLTGNLKNLTTEENDDEKYVLFQLPEHLPDYKRKSSKVKLENDVEMSKDEETLKGQIGTVNIHQSGKITIDLGNGIRLNVTKGSSTDFLQELAVLDLNQDSNENEDIQMIDDSGREMLGKLVRLGTVSDKIIATPYFMSESNESLQDTTFNVQGKIILSIDYLRDTLGITCLDVGGKKLYIYEDFQICNPNSYIEAVIDELKPNLLFISSRLSDKTISFIKTLESLYEFEVSIKAVADFVKFDVQSVVSSFNTYLGGIKSKLFSDLAVSSPFFKLGTGTLNALYLGISEHISELSIAEMIDSLELCNFKNRLFIDVDSMYALQILPDPREKLKAHSKSQKLSLSDLINFTVTQEGYRLLLDWIRKPLADLELIQDRQQLVQLLSYPEFNERRKSITRMLKQIRGSFVKIKKIRSNEISWSNWKALLLFLSNSMSISKLMKEYIFKNSTTIKESLKVSSLLDDDIFEFQKLNNFLLEIIEPESSAEEGRVKITNGVDEELDRLIIVNNNIEEILRDCTHQLREFYSIQDCNAIYIPQLGFLISKSEDESKDDVPQDWQLVFATPTNSYYKTQEVEHLDEQYGDVHTMINDREIEIVQVLQEEVMKYETLIDMVIEALVELDCLCSLSLVSEFPEYTFPTLTDGYDLFIDTGRHPLVETNSNIFIPNSIDYQTEKITIITGANFSGKSVYINQVALIVVLAQIGCAVPAKSARIGVVDKLLTRISSRESLEKQQSTFAIDINQLSKCISLCTDRSLIIIDEFGKGSDSIDSPALFGGALAYFANLADCPRCLMSTHFHELFSNNVIMDKLSSSKVKYITTEIELKKSNNKVEDITYLYKVKPGIARESFGIYCAKTCGIPMHIINKAEYFAEKLEEGTDIRYRYEIFGFRFCRRK
ncbi:uncharacterized protein KGF55_001080 [Candida pseudojiufengensis]|uniref:uncharacterized protein n=1 Tax=Candida pseudojiufengensis TaxID=497109 RepID=UPI0022254993|nr:uncharacterized protein KGF55_001080 [Candida pseudojiufengensis]KAI5965717.1 hypothetical protein KGF55_001080 [Candida pseudojiufengensis]